MKKLFFTILFSYSTISCFAQIQWQKCLGGSSFDNGSIIRQTFDGGYIVAGTSTSTDGDVTGNHGHEDYWVVKLSASGSIEWEKSYGGSGQDFATCVQQTSDSGYIVAGTSTSTDGDVTGNHGLSDYWVLKLSRTGSIQWQKCLGGRELDVAESVQQTTDGGYIVVGYSQSFNGDVTGHFGTTPNEDYWVVKLSSTGSIEWQKCLGGTGLDQGQSVRQTYDGGYIVAGFSGSVDGDVTGNHGGFDYWIVKLSSVGSIQWQQSYGGSMNDYATSIEQTVDSGYIIAGYSSSNDGDVTGNHGYIDCWIVKLSSSGTLQWQTCLGGSGQDQAVSVQQTTDSGYIIAGGTYSNDDEVSGNHGTEDCWIVKLFHFGSIQWQVCLGGSAQDASGSIQQTADGGYIVGAGTFSNDGNISGNHGNTDYWVVKLDPKTGIDNIANVPPISIMPNPTTGIINVKGAGMVNIKVYNTIGQLVKEASNTDNISISGYPPGLYLF